MSTAIRNTRREVAMLIALIFENPATPESLKETLLGGLTEAYDRIDLSNTPEGIELYLDTLSEIDRKGYGGGEPNASRV